MRRNEYRFAAHPDGSITFEGSREVPRNPNADRNTSPDQKRRMAYRAARRMFQNAQLPPGMSDREIEAVAVDIAEECDCSEAVAQRAVRTMVGGNLRDDAPAMPERAVVPALIRGIPVRISDQNHTGAVSALQDFSRTIRSFGNLWYGGAAPDAFVSKPPPAPPQSFERPKRRIVLE